MSGFCDSGGSLYTGEFCFWNTKWNCPIDIASFTVSLMCQRAQFDLYSILYTPKIIYLHDKGTTTEHMRGENISLTLLS